MELSRAPRDESFEPDEGGGGGGADGGALGAGGGGGGGADEGAGGGGAGRNVEELIVYLKKEMLKGNGRPSSGLIPYLQILINIR